MRNLSMKFLVILVLGFFFNSCEKEKDIQPAPTPLVNPFEEAGLLHNQILDDIIALPGLKEMKKSEVLSFISRKVNEKYPNTVVSFDRDNAELMADYFQAPYETLLKLNAITAKEYEYLKRIEKAMSCCPDNVLDQLEKILRDILSPLPPPFNPMPTSGGSNGEGQMAEGTIVLITEAIARNSFQYWQKQQADPNSPWKQFELSGDQLAGVCPGCNIGGADAAGAGSAAVYTWWTGPFSVGATVATGVGASAGQALWELATWLWD
ncbi:MAG: hypothetical protein R2828_03395 [Saprospiraceae bacterium]